MMLTSGQSHFAGGSVKLRLPLQLFGNTWGIRAFKKLYIPYLFINISEG